MKDQTNLDRDAELEGLALEYSKSFTKFSDIEGVIIRGHILIEQALNRSIELTVLNKSEYNADRFSFAQKIQIANMLGISEFFKTELNSLNKLRNQIAHSLKYEEKYIDVIIKGIYKKDSKLFGNKKDKYKSLIIAISFIAGAISYGHEYAKHTLLKKQIESVAKAKQKTLPKK